MPLAEAKLLAIEEDKSRGGRRLVRVTPGRGFRRGDKERRAISDFEARSSATAAEVDAGFSAVERTSASPEFVVTGCSAGYRSSSDSRWWCCSRSLNVLKASALPVPDAALANSPAARACSLMATVESALCVAIEAARA